MGIKVGQYYIDDAKIIYRLCDVSKDTVCLVDISSDITINFYSMEVSDIHEISPDEFRKLSGGLNISLLPERTVNITVDLVNSTSKP